MVYIEDTRPHENCPACSNCMDDYVATMEVPCGVCEGPTVPPTPGHSEERDYVCDYKNCVATTTKEGVVVNGPIRVDPRPFDG